MICARSEKGKYREKNEDFFTYFTDDRCSFIILADGIGGISGGEIASRLASKGVADLILTELLDAINDITFEQFRDLIIEYFRSANRSILLQAIEEPSYQGMGSTLTLALVRNDELFVAHIGDTRCYLISDGHITKLTEDHVYKVSEGRCHELVKSMGENTFITPDVYRYNIRSKDIVFLVSDGIYDVVDDNTMLRTYIDNPIEQAVDVLVDRAIRNNSNDNMSVVAIMI